MPETVLKAPNYFDREFDLTERTVPVGGIPATIIGGAVKGPAFTPVTLGSYTDFQDKFGALDPKYVGGYGVQKFLDAKGPQLASVNYIRVLGCGANSTAAHISETAISGTVLNAGTKIVGDGTAFTSGALEGVVQFLVAKHAVAANESFGYPMFNDNNSYDVNGVAPDSVNLVRAVLFTTVGARFIVASGSVAHTYNPATITAGTNNYESAYVGTEGPMKDLFKLILSSSAGVSFASDDNLAGLRIYSASLNPTSDQYIGKILNTNPENFAEKKHLLYLDYPVDAEVAALSSSQVSSLEPTIAVLSGSSIQNSLGLSFGSVFGYYNTRYQAPKTSNFISQPFGGIEYDLFYVESIDDGEFANNQYKVSITNLYASTNPSTLYGSFTLLVRAFGDTDISPQIVESFSNLSLDPEADNYIAKVIGDKKSRFNFDAIDLSDRALTVSGKYGNRSKYIRVVPSPQLESGEVPEKALPFGFRGHQMLLTNTSLTDQTGSANIHITGVSASAAPGGCSLSGSIVPPVPFRFTVSRNNLATSGTPGAAGVQTVVDGRLFWGVKFERNNQNILNVNVNEGQNSLLQNFTKFSGIEKLGVLTTGSASDLLNNNKFSLANVALPVSSFGALNASSVPAVMKEAAYIRNASLDLTTYNVSTPAAAAGRMTFASLLNVASPIVFNNYAQYAKFTTFMQGGWNGTNIFDKQASRFTDRSTSTEEGVNSTYGLANASYVSPGAPAATNYTGTGTGNSNVAAYQTAITIGTNPSIANNNILLVPGQRDPLITDYALQKNLEYGLSFYPMDIQPYDQNGQASGRIFDGETGRFVSIAKTSDAFVARAVDNNAAASYFPSVVAEDTVNNRRVTLPASIAAISALSYNDRVKFPWFAPAGFDRGSLSWAILTQIRINQSDRDKLSDANINPIVKFPGANYVFFSQNTMQQAESALESINVKRMVLEVKRQMVAIGNRLLFEQNNPAIRSRFVNEASIVLVGVQLQQGIEKFAVICDASNNTAEDVNSNRLNAQIRVLPTRAIEYIVMDFIVLPSGVQL